MYEKSKLQKNDYTPFKNNPEKFNSQLKTGNEKRSNSTQSRILEWIYLNIKY